MVKTRMFDDVTEVDSVGPSGWKRHASSAFVSSMESPMPLLPADEHFVPSPAYLQWLQLLSWCGKVAAHFFELLSRASFVAKEKSMRFSRRMESRLAEFKVRG